MRKCGYSAQNIAEKDGDEKGNIAERTMCRSSLPTLTRRSPSNPSTGISTSTVLKVIRHRKDGGIRPAIILNKTDLISKEDLEEKLEQIKRRLGGIDVVATSTRTNEGLKNFENISRKGKTYCFCSTWGNRP